MIAIAKATLGIVGLAILLFLCILIAVAVVVPAAIYIAFSQEGS